MRMYEEVVNLGVNVNPPDHKRESSEQEKQGLAQKKVYE